MQKVVDDIIANYEIIGENNKNTILILHGWRRNLNDWTNVGKALSNKYRVILLDLPGHGSTLSASRPFDTLEYANFVNKFLEKIGVNKAILIGHSLGGKIALVISSESKKVNKLIVVAASGLADKPVSTLIKISLAKILKKLPLPQTIITHFVLILASRDYKTAGDLLPSFKKIVNEKVDDYARRITIPTLIIWGENDKEVPISSAKKFRELIKNSHIRVVWGAGHHPHLEKPDKFLALLNEYL